MADFFIMHMQRSGGTFLSHMLNLHPDIYCWDEIFKPSKNPSRKYVTRTEFKREMDSRQKKYYGCRIPYGHINDEVVKFIQDNKMKGIHLIRKNLLRQAMFQKKTFAYSDSGNIVFNIPQIKKCIQCVLNYVEFYKNMAGFVLFYEDFTNGGQHVSEFQNKILRKQMFSYLGIDDYPLSSNYTRFKEKELSNLLAKPISDNFFNDLPNICENYQELLESDLLKYTQWKFSGL